MLLSCCCTSRTVGYQALQEHARFRVRDADIIIELVQLFFKEFLKLFQARDRYHHQVCLLQRQVKGGRYCSGLAPYHNRTSDLVVPSLLARVPGDPKESQVKR